MGRFRDTNITVVKSSRGCKSNKNKSVFVLLCASALAAFVLTLGVGQEAVERREVAWARGDSEGVVLREAVSLGNTCTPREIMESGI